MNRPDARSNLADHRHFNRARCDVVPEGVASVKSMWNISDYGDGILAGAAGTLMLLIGLVLLMIRAVRIGMRQ